MLSYHSKTLFITSNNGKGGFDWHSVISSQETSFMSRREATAESHDRDLDTKLYSGD